MLDSSSVSATASIGIAFGSTGAGSDEMLRNADLAMYTAKAGGKNCARVFAREMHLAAVERLDLEAHLRGAAERGELVVHYQPIYELRTGRITAFEALVRWHHPERGLLGPLSFIPFAEETGLIDEIGHHVLGDRVRGGRAGGSTRSAASRARDQRQRRRPASCSTRDSPTGSRRSSTDAASSPHRLILEITEGALMKDPAAATVGLQRLSELGVRLAVDDFGTGYSSLAYLQRFPIDILKIDRSFVNDMLTPLGIARWSQAIVQISHTLGLVRSPRASRARRRPTRSRPRVRPGAGLPPRTPGRRRRDPRPHPPGASPAHVCRRAVSSSQGVVASPRVELARRSCVRMNVFEDPGQALAATLEEPGLLGRRSVPALCADSATRRRWRGTRHSASGRSPWRR